MYQNNFNHISIWEVRFYTFLCTRILQEIILQEFNRNTRWLGLICIYRYLFIVLLCIFQCFLQPFELSWRVKRIGKIHLITSIPNIWIQAHHQKWTMLDLVKTTWNIDSNEVRVIILGLINSCKTRCHYHRNKIYRHFIMLNII